MPIEFDNKITIQKVRNNRDKYFVFGDNDQHVGIGGTAVIRDCWNSLGIRTKRSPHTTKNSYWSDDDYKLNCSKIDKDIGYITTFLLRGCTVVFPVGMIGKGLAKLHIKAPKTFQYLETKLQQLFEVYSQRNRDMATYDSKLSLAKRMASKIIDSLDEVTSSEDKGIKLSNALEPHEMEALLVASYRMAKQIMQL